MSGLGVTGTPLTGADGGPVLYTRNYDETLTVGDNFDGNLDNHDLLSNQSVGFADTISFVKRFARDRGETLGLEDSIARRFGIALSDALEYAEKNDLPYYILEGLGVDDAIGRAAGYTRSVSEGLDISDVIGRGQGKAYSDEAALSDAMARKLYKNINENLGLIDTLLRNANAVVFDLVIRDDILTADDLDTLADSPPVGYTPFQKFLPGDYEYQEVMAGVRVSGVSGGTQVGILGLKLNVDVPDVTERGEATVTAGEAAGTGEHTVTFTKTFTAVPEVYPVWINGATPALPEIISVTATQFVFILRDISSPSTKVEGTISWAAIGR